MTSPVDLPRVKLAELVAQRDASICQNAKDCATRLRSECGLEYDDECAALAAAVDAGIVAELQHGLLSSVPRSVLLRRLSQRLANGSNLPAYLAQWSVECWALALGVVRASDDLLSLKLERLLPPLNAVATNAVMSAERLDRLVRDAASSGIDEPIARAFIARYAARSGWLVGQPPEPSALTTEASGARRTIPRSPTIPGTGTPAPGPVSAGAPALKTPDPQQAERHSAGAKIFRWRGAVFVLVILAAIGATAIDRHFKTLPASPSLSAARRVPTQTAASNTDQRSADLRKSERIDHEQRTYNAARGNREALQGYIDSCEICVYREAALQEKARLDAADREERVYKAARGNKEALLTYIGTCTVCAYKSAALEEKARIDSTVEQEERAYTTARGSKLALQAYISTCALCAHRAAAQSEIGAIEAAQPRRIASTINICGKPVDFVIEATGVPAAYRGFLGVWTGAAWNSRVCGGLIVRRVESDGSADIVYIYGPLPGEKFLWKAQHPAATISARKLTFEDEEEGSFVFNQTYDNTLHGLFTGKEGAKLDAILTRELSSVP